MSRLQRARRRVRARTGWTGNIHTPTGRAGLIDEAIERGLWPCEGVKVMFDGLELGTVIAVRTFDFPYVGEVTEITDMRITLRNAVLVLWDGRHGDCWQKGKPPEQAEIEATLPLLHISTDDVRQWGPYPGGKIPKPQ